MNDLYSRLSDAYYDAWLCAINHHRVNKAQSAGIFHQMSTPEQSNEETLESNRRHSTTEGFRRSITRTDARPPSSNSFAMGEHQQGTVRRGLNSLTATPEESQVINNSNPSTLQKAKRDRVIIGV